MKYTYNDISDAHAEAQRIEVVYLEERGWHHADYRWHKTVGTVVYAICCGDALHVQWELDEQNGAE